LVIGTGAAGMAAALSALESSRGEIRVLILEKTGEEAWGGNTRYTTANMRLLDESKLLPSVEEDFKEFTKGKADWAHVKVILSRASETIAWLKSKGVEFESRPSNWPGYNLPRIGPVGGGLAVISTLRKHVEVMGGRVLFKTTAWKLSLDGQGRVDGVWVRDSSGRVQRIGAKAVILACGGFEGNYEMLVRYLGREAVNLRMDNPATPLHMGECINMALEVGAKTSGDFGGWHGSLHDTRSKAYRPMVHLYPFGVLVNKMGKRFVNEAFTDVSDSFEVIARSVFEQPDHVAFVILDRKVTLVPGYQKAVKTDHPPITASTLEELAEKLGVNKEGFLRTVKEFNAAVQPEFNAAVQPGTFNPNVLDGKGTKGVEPPKSNWALPIDEPPFMAYPVECTVQFTYGGLATDENARVLATNDSPIPGLYAAGEMVGLYYHRYVGGTSVLRALIFGRIAGANAVDYTRSLR